MFSLRERFVHVVGERDRGLCVWCGEPGTEVHHLLDSRLFPDGGHDASNGVLLCPKCHWEAEKTSVSVEELRSRAGIRAPFLPSGFEPSSRYDKWGNEILGNGRRLKGPLFEDEGARKALDAGGFLALFTDLVKYPRTLHLPWSEGISDDDKVLGDVASFLGREVVMMEKMDGENTTLYSNYLHARSVDSNHHPSRSWVKALHARIGHEIPEGFRICGENLYALHTIPYDDLESFFLVFSIWDDKNFCLSWDETVEYCELLGLSTVPVLWRGIFDESVIRKVWDERESRRGVEGYVIRPAGSFHFSRFSQQVAKYVSAEFRSHLDDNDVHWASAPVVPNRLLSARSSV